MQNFKMKKDEFGLIIYACKRKPTTNHCRQPALQLSDGNAKKAADFLRIPLPRDATVPC